MNSDIDRAVANAIKPLDQKIRDLERKLAAVEKQINAHEKVFSDFLRKLNPRNR